MNCERILVVDDNPTNLKLASDLLEFEGYRVLQAVGRVRVAGHSTNTT